MSTWDVYCFLGVYWAGFSVGVKLTQYRHGTLPWLVTCALLNFFAWPVTVCMALYFAGKKGTL